MKNIAIAMSVLLSSACAMTSEDYQRGLNDKLVGKPTSFAIEKFGQPSKTDMFQIKNAKMYLFHEWGVSGTMQIKRPTSQQTFGQVGGQFFNATTTGYIVETIPAACRIRVVFSHNTKIITEVMTDGNSCDYYYDKVK